MTGPDNVSGLSSSLAEQVVKIFLGARLPAAADQAVSVEAEAASLVAKHTAVLRVRVCIGHAECMARCARSVPIEQWTISMETRSANLDMKQVLPAHFLLNAVRSHVHFSQLSSWLANCGESTKKKLFCSYDCIPYDDDLRAPVGGVVNEHAFPMSADPSWPGYTLRVTVQAVHHETMIQPSGICLQLGPLPTDEWLLPSPLPSPSGREDGITVAEMGLSTPPNNMSETKLRALLSVPLIARLMETPPGRVLHHTDPPPAPPKKRTPAVQQRRERSTTRRALATTPVASTYQRHKLRPLLGSFEENALKGRLSASCVGMYTAQIMCTDEGAGACTPFIVPLPACALAVPETSGWCIANGSTERSGKRGYRIPAKGKIQLTLLNPDGAAVRVYLMEYNETALPASSSTFIRHRVTMESIHGSAQRPILRHLLHISVRSDHAGRVYIAGDVKVLFSTDMSVDGLNIEIGKNGVGSASKNLDMISQTNQPYAPAHSSRIRKLRSSVTE